MSRYHRARSGNTYFFTVVTYNRKPLLCLEESRSILREVVLELRQNHPFTIKCWVLLPEHMHCIWELPKEDSNYSMRWGWLKKEFTKRIRNHESCRTPVGTAHPTITALPETSSATPLVGTAHPTSSRFRRREEEIWQRRFWEHMIRDDEDYRMHCDYVHFNPVKHGLVSSPKDWPYSTFHQFVKRGIYSESWGGANLEFPENMGGE